ncbi:hypothetical protein NK553_17660 [Pseudomonas sp. ZM23]|uniref:Uncharacterized protein n=1 Tax=Pseudomonas triclosanedens TaxID=2961893 RepID=A0ABY7A3M3_9PSED|nr:hypothetical protein [Pseudomonas triclosanedens]MCP8465779.1 hypothetical protein [Pseudomonas triclosanedens]MCP8471274.1 hypothetical protein [Pseudomonas triclosanedens]MCP8477078.1 hypothetical protein [Pseudomonas triclosanedens]WAI51814.1 hypothetical protein OU419_11380 [Pseudomonas triclosanedens]
MDATAHFIPLDSTSLFITLAIIVFGMFMLGIGFTIRHRGIGVFLMWVGVLSMLSIITYRIYLATSV